MTRRRLDVELVRRGLATSRQQAGQLVESGRVLVDGSLAAKSAAMVAPGQAVTVAGPPAPFVSRGGEKLERALDRFAVVVAGRRCLDVGASTGGFADCLLQHGAASVVAVDSGHGQLHPRIRADGRVTVLERTNARHLPEEHPELVGSAEVVVADVSFISLTVLVPALLACAAGPGSDLVLLVKPQFEVGRAEVSRGRGVVRDPAARSQALGRVAGTLTAHGARVVGATASPILGPAGNAEFFLHATAGPAAGVVAPTAAPLPAPSEAEDAAWAELVAAAVAAAPDAPGAEAPSAGPPADIHDSVAGGGGG